MGSWRMILMGVGLLTLTVIGCGGVAPVSIDQVQVKPAGAWDILALAQKSDAKAVLVNIWATWCAPCREEFPDIVRLARKYNGRGLKVVLVSADFDTELADVRRFLAQQGVDFPTYIKNEKDMEFIDVLDKRWTGALPATFIYDGTGKLKHFWEGKATYRDFERRVLDAFGS